MSGEGAASTTTGAEEQAASPLADERARIATYYQYRAEAQIAQQYNLFNRGNLYRVQRLERDLLDALSRHGFEDLSDKWIIDIGCGNGSFLRRLTTYGANRTRIMGVDLLPQRIEHGRLLYPELDLRCLDASEIPFPDGVFDLAFQMTVLSSILEGRMRRAVAAEIARVLKPGGALVSYDFRVVRDPRNTRPISSGDLRRLFPDFELDVRRVTLAPPLAAALANRSWIACELLEAIPVLRTHELAVLRKRAISHQLSGPDVLTADR